MKTPKNSVPTLRDALKVYRITISQPSSSIELSEALDELDNGIAIGCGSNKKPVQKDMALAIAKMAGEPGALAEFEKANAALIPQAIPGTNAASYLAQVKAMAVRQGRPLVPPPLPPAPLAPSRAIKVGKPPALSGGGGGCGGGSSGGGGGSSKPDEDRPEEGQRRGKIGGQSRRCRSPRSSGDGGPGGRRHGGGGRRRCPEPQPQKRT